MPLDREYQDGRVLGNAAAKNPDKIVTVLMTGELAEQLEEWSSPVQLKIIKTPGIGTGYEAIARTAEIAGVPVTEHAGYHATEIAGYRVRLFHSNGSPNWQTFRPEDVEIIRVEAQPVSSDT